MDSIAAQIRALIPALAGLPDIALVAGGPAILLVVIILLFVVIGAMGGGKKKRARQEDQDEVEDYEPPSRHVRPAPPPPPRPAPAPAARAPAAPARAPAPAAPAPAAPDKRTSALIEVLRKARPASAGPQSNEERLAQDAAVQRIAKSHPAVVKALQASNLKEAFVKLEEEATALEEGKKPNAAQVWRDLGVLAEGIDSGVSLRGFEHAYQLNVTDFWGDVFLARAWTRAGNVRDALTAAQAANAHAQGTREKAIGHAEVGDVCLQLNRVDDARAAYERAIEMLRALARSGERKAQRDLSVGLNKLGDLERASENIPRACTLFREDLQITKYLAKADPQSNEAQRDFLISLAKLAEASREHVYWVEARDQAETMARAGRLDNADKPLLDLLRKQAAAA